MHELDYYRRHLMKRLIAIVFVVVIGATVTIAATTRTGTSRTPAQPPTKASLMDAYVQAAKYWQNRPVSAASAKPPTTASLMPAYVQATKYWQNRKLSR
jgi:hypothetical protein